MWNPGGYDVDSLTTPRMRLVPSTVDLVRAEIGDRPELARLLGATVPVDWPPDEAADALPWFLERLEAAGSRGIGWYGFYGVVVSDLAGAPVLVGTGGSLGPPVDGVAEIGYSMLPAYHGHGYATEMMTAIVDWLGRNPAIREVRAETDHKNMASRRLLARVGLEASGPGRDPGTIAYLHNTQRAPIRAEEPE